MALTSRERVIRTLRFEPVDRIARDVWTLPAAFTGRDAELRALLAEYPRDFGASGYQDPLDESRLYEEGEWTDQWGTGWINIQAGMIGEVREVHAFCSDSYYPWGHAGWSPKEGRVPEETMPVPETLNWDLWLGPAAERPYHACYHPMAWRAFQAFGSGWMADRGAHSLDPVKWALNLGHPSRVSATSTGTTDEMHPVSAIVTFEFPKRGKMPPVSVTWYTGLHIPRPAGVPGDEQIGDETGGILFIGSDGMMTCDTYGERPRLLPAARMKKFKAPEPSIPRIEGESIEGDWVRAIRNGTKACADFSYSGPLSEICALGNIAKRFDDTPIEWDHERMTVTNLPDANQYVRTPYREGWSL